EVLFEECLQAMLGTGEFVPVRIHGDELGILVDVLVEHVDETREGLMTPNGFEDRFIAGLCHRSFLRWGRLRGRCCGSPGRWAGAWPWCRLPSWPRPTASAGRGRRQRSLPVRPRRSRRRCRAECAGPSPGSYRPEPRVWLSR